VALSAVPVGQEDPDDTTSAAFKHDVVLDGDAGRFVVALDGEDDDDLDLFVLHDRDGDGEFAVPDEVVASSSTSSADEVVELPGVTPAGRYQVWVHGWRVAGESSAFDIEIDVVSGDAIQLGSVPTTIPAGATTPVEVCADLTVLDDMAGPADGLILLGPGGAPTLLELPVTWQRARPALHLPLSLRGWTLAAEPAPPPAP
jgi:hypothetical protein